MYENKVTGLGNINGGLMPPSKIIKELGVNRLKLMGFSNVTDEDIHPSRSKYKDSREKVIKLGENERSKAIKSSFTKDAEAIELMEINI